MRVPFAAGREMLFKWSLRGLVIVTVALFLTLFFFEASLNVGSKSFFSFLQSRSTTSYPRTTSTGTIHRRLSNTTNIKSCLDPYGPHPFILMALGRTGSGLTFQTIGNLTGQETPAEEYTGSSPIRSTRFFDRIQNDNGLWVTNNLCKKQQQYPNAPLVGFKWKPWKSIYSQPALDGLNFIAQSQNPAIKIVRLRRNLLDVRLSTLKRRQGKMKKGHCSKGDEKCLKKHLKAGSNITVPIEDMIEYLETMSQDEDDVDALLDNMNVPHVHVTYERLYHKDSAADEWMKIFRFLGVGPSEGLTLKQVSNAMGMEPTSHARHRDTIFNYNELKEALEGTEFENLLHL